MFVRHRYPYTYTVLRSVRTPAGPRQQCVAHWRGTPSLGEAIRQARAGLETSLALCRQRRTLEANRERLDRERAQIAKLEAAQAVLGDWTDPIERPADAAWWAMSHHDRWQVHQDRRRAAARERSPEAEAEREHKRWLESMMKMAM